MLGSCSYASALCHLLATVCRATTGSAQVSAHTKQHSAQHTWHVTGAAHACDSAMESVDHPSSLVMPRVCSSSCSLVCVCACVCFLLLCCCCCRHFVSEGVVPDLYFMEWCMTLFCKRLKLGRHTRTKDKGGGGGSRLYGCFGCVCVYLVYMLAPCCLYVSYLLQMWWVVCGIATWWKGKQWYTPQALVSAHTHRAPLHIEMSVGSRPSPPILSIAAPAVYVACCVVLLLVCCSHLDGIT